MWLAEARRIHNRISDIGANEVILVVRL